MRRRDHRRDAAVTFAVPEPTRILGPDHHLADAQPPYESEDYLQQLTSTGDDAHASWLSHAQRSQVV